MQNLNRSVWCLFGSHDPVEKTLIHHYQLSYKHMTCYEKNKNARQFL